MTQQDIHPIQTRRYLKPRLNQFGTCLYRYDLIIFFFKVGRRRLNRARTSHSSTRSGFAGKAPWKYGEKQIELDNYLTETLHELEMNCHKHILYTLMGMTQTLN